MDPEPDVIKHEIDETASSLKDKLETLENEVLGTVKEATETVEETISNVKETVQDTVQAVKRTFDLRYQTEQHPWLMVGGSAAAGFVAGMFLGGRRHARRPQDYYRAGPDYSREQSFETSRYGM